MIKEFFKKLTISGSHCRAHLHDNKIPKQSWLLALNGIPHFALSGKATSKIGSSLCSQSAVGHDNLCKRVAFTLAEVLITLGIIGVVAALTIPTLNKKINAIYVKTRLKQTFAIITQAMKYTQNEFGDLETWGFNGDWNSTHDMDIFSGYFNRYLKITLDCGYTNEKGCVVNAPNYEIDGQPNSVNYATCTKPYYYKLLLQNGASLYYRTGNRPEDGGDPNKMYIFIDVNGQKGPNTWGRDIFEYSSTKFTLNLVFCLISKSIEYKLFPSGKNTIVLS